VLYEENKPIPLADALEGLLAKPDEAFAMGSKGHEVVLKRFSNDRLAKELVDNILAPKPVSA
jgi:hypothetical protein